MTLNLNMKPQINNNNIICSLHYLLKLLEYGLKDGSLFHIGPLNKANNSLPVIIFMFCSEVPNIFLAATRYEYAAQWITNSHTTLLKQWH